MSPLIPRIHFYEIADQSWFPAFLREKVQAALTLLWTTRFPPFQSLPPASLVARILQSVLGRSIDEYVFVDFCSGAGGPTPKLEREVNKALALESIDKYHAKQQQKHSVRKDATASAANGNPTRRDDDNNNDADPSSSSVDFILTDLFPHIPSWKRACSTSAHLHYIPTPINACSTPSDMLSLTRPPLASTSTKKSHQKKPFHLFSLAFHHFPDPLARLVLRDALASSAGFAVLELQARDPPSFLTMLLLAPALWLASWHRFRADWTHLFFTYAVPLVPLVVVLDGLVSCLRTRTPGEILALMEGVEGMEGWRFESGREAHTWPAGEVSWFVGIKEAEPERSI
ncbi:MAG: hypothetical protein LQ348_002976 [Seirophora lacunosa]|nr:MAG: hypothetical protein LQ348_002976 [Seirophora lacunosa]